MHFLPWCMFVLPGNTLLIKSKVWLSGHFRLVISFFATDFTCNRGNHQKPTSSGYPSPFVPLDSWLMYLVPLSPFFLPFPLLPTWPSSAWSCPLWTLPDTPACDYALPYICNKFSPPPYLGKVMSFLLFLFFSFLQLLFHFHIQKATNRSLTLNVSLKTFSDLNIISEGSKKYNFIIL